MIILRRLTKYRILPADVAVIFYLTVTAVLLLFLPDPLSGYAAHFYFRLIVMAGIAVIIVADSKFKTNFTRFLHLFYPLTLLGYVYGETALLNHIFFTEDLDPIFINLDEAVFGFQPAIEFSKTFPQVWFSELMNLGYFSYYFMPVVVSLVVYFTERDFAEKVVFLIISSFLIYYLIFIVFPVTGPQFYFKPPLSGVPVTGIFSRAVKAVQEIGEHPTGAFPSSHVGMALIFLRICRKSSVVMFWILIPFVFLILFATVYIKAHYAVDVIGGILSAPLVLFAGMKLWQIISI
jgi:membrane-associated phospholipid phosphatase